MSYTKEQILTYLNEQPDLKSAIENIDNITTDKRKIVMDGKTLFYIEDHIKTKGQLKQRIIEYMGEEGWELSGYEEVMKLQEILDICKMKVI